MLMDVIAYVFGVIAVAAGVLCFLDENFLGKRIEQEEAAATSKAKK